MAKRLTFSQFQTALAARSLPTEVLPNYVEFDPEAPIPKLAFRYDALLDSPDPDYNVDTELYNYLRELEEIDYIRTSAFHFVEKNSVVAEGDSWFNLPAFFRPPAIADWIKLNRRFHMKNIAYWGHTIAEILDRREYMETIERIRPDFFMFCGGGNDLQIGLSKHSYLHPYHPERSHDDYLTEAGNAGLTKIMEAYVRILSEITNEFPTTRVLCHGYDFPRPLVGQGKYIGRHFRKLNIPDGEMNSIVTSILNRFNDVIIETIEPLDMVEFVNLRHGTDDFTWYDDMHPDREGFRALAKKFEDTMSR